MTGHSKVSRCLLSVFVLSASTLCAASAQAQGDGKSHFVPESRAKFLPVIVYQPSCPIEFLVTEMLRHEDGAVMANYKVRNISDKPIVEARIATIEFAGGGSLTEFKPSRSEDWLFPSASWPAPMRKSDALKRQIHDPLVSQNSSSIQPGGIANVRFFMIVSVVFSDGTKYSDEALYRSIREMCEKMEPPMLIK